MRRILMLAVLWASVSAALAQGAFNLVTIGYLNITLQKGWNLIYGPLQESSAGFQGGHPEFTAYYQTENGWEGVHYPKDTPPEVANKFLGSGRPVFVYMSQAATLTHVGSILLASEQTLRAGLNATGKLVPVTGTPEQVGLEPTPSFGIYKLRMGRMKSFGSTSSR